VARSAASRIAASEIDTGAITKEALEAGGSGGRSTWTAFGKVARGDSQSMALRVRKNETATTAIAIPTTPSVLV
jgi:glutamate dehydrogenase/leucine dehydrogenase